MASLQAGTVAKTERKLREGCALLLESHGWLAAKWEAGEAPALGLARHESRGGQAGFLSLV